MSPQRSQVDLHILSSPLKDFQQEEASSRRQGKFGFSESLNVWQQKMRKVVVYRAGLHGPPWPSTLSCLRGLVTSEEKQNQKPIAQRLVPEL